MKLKSGLRNPVPSTDESALRSNYTLTYQNLPVLQALIINPNTDFIRTPQKSRFWRVKVGGSLRHGSEP